MREPICPCLQMPSVQTVTRFVILQHQLETMKPTNTARIAHLAMPNSEIVTYGVEQLDFEAVAPAGTWLLYPDGEEPPPSSDRPSRMLVLDGNWTQTRRMLHRLPELRRLPRLSLSPAKPDRLRMRQQRDPAGMSTLEAIAQAVSQLEGPQKGALLDLLHDGMTERVMRARGLIR